MLRLLRRAATDQEEVGLRGKDFQIRRSQHRGPLGAAGDQDLDPPPRLRLGLQGHTAGDDPGVADVVWQLHLQQLRNQPRIGQQVAEAHPCQGPRLGEGPEEHEVGILRQQRPVVPTAELAVGVVEEERSFQTLQQALHLLRRDGASCGIVRRAENQRPARIALDLGFQLLDRDAQVQAGRQEPGDPGRLEHEATIKPEARLGPQHLAAGMNHGGQCHRQQLV
jgi:hypothetical protein